MRQQEKDKLGLEEESKLNNKYHFPNKIPLFECISYEEFDSELDGSGFGLLFTIIKQSTYVFKYTGWYKSLNKAKVHKQLVVRYNTLRIKLQLGRKLMFFYIRLNKIKEKI